MKYDYIILGGGSAGCTLAGRLSENPQVSVCLIEAGGDGKSPLIRFPVGTALMVPGPPVLHNRALALHEHLAPGRSIRRGEL